MATCVQTITGRFTPRHHGDDASHDCCKRSTHKKPDAPVFEPVILNEETVLWLDEDGYTVLTEDDGSFIVLA